MKKTSKSKTKDKILVNKKMSFGEILNRYPQTAGVLMENGMHCFGCSMAMYETLEQGALMHGVNPDKLVEKINKMIGKKK
jgi:hybrid cluster-associated redox disulfide protein